LEIFIAHSFNKLTDCTDDTDFEEKALTEKVDEYIGRKKRKEQIPLKTG